MTLRRSLLLFLLGLGAVLAVAAFQRTPGYMDADYYYAGGLRLAQGQGLSEPFLWNYLDDPAGLPHPSHAYWMPLASFLAAAGMWASGAVGFWAGRLGFLLAAACLPPLTAGLAYTLTRRSDSALLAGLLAVFPAFYLPFLPTTDNFGLYMLLGGAWFLAVGRNRETSELPASKPWLIFLQPLALGLLAGLMHLARADGVLWLGMSLLAVGLQAAEASRPDAGSLLRRLAPLALCLLGYLLVMGPWMLRNQAVFGSLLAPGGGRALWITQYDELFAYPASLLTPAHWWSAGLGALVRARLAAAGQNLESAFAVQGEIFLFPLILIGGWTARRDRRVRWGGLAWLLTFLALSLAFPYQGARGGFFHSGAALQPLLWALVPVGLEAFMGWGQRVRGWQPALARPVFQAGLVGLALLLTLLIVRSRLWTPGTDGLAWDETANRYARLEQGLQGLGAQAGEVVLVNNPPGYYLAADRPAVYTPFGAEPALLAAAQRFQARYLLLEYDHPQPLDELYDRPGDRPGLAYLQTIAGTRIFRVQAPSPGQEAPCSCYPPR